MVQFLREVQYLIEYALIWPVVMLARSLSDRNAERLTKLIARAAYGILSRDRKWAYRNLELVFGNNLSAEEKKRIVIGAFETIVRTRVECIRWTPEWMRTHVVEEGGEAGRAFRDKMSAEGKGVVLITAHIGNYELLPAWGHYHGLPTTVMYRPQNNWRVERLLLGARHEYLPNAVRRSTTGLMTLGYVVREGGNAGLLVDMNTLDNPAFVDFLGFKAASPPGAAALALSTGAAVMLAVSVRREDGKHRMIFHPPFETIRTGNKRRDVIANTQQYMKAIESYVLAFPEQYNWPHPRWRFRPNETYWTANMPIEEIEKERISPVLSRVPDPTPVEIRRSAIEEYPRAA